MDVPVAADRAAGQLGLRVVRDGGRGVVARSDNDESIIVGTMNDVSLRKRPRPRAQSPLEAHYYRRDDMAGARTAWSSARSRTRAKAVFNFTDPAYIP
ncbi:unnamed protein product [Miscanthus lutarioriparius]|uniref:Uncharacterized protein n=1 Tax=Miscanthus lutarioriparius TaxID=422564 RepID=A0A811QA30_9POAL|nr:unnamed protein product [Miscanthus lutarioriparius]